MVQIQMEVPEQQETMSVINNMLEQYNCLTPMPVLASLVMWDLNCEEDCALYQAPEELT